MLTSLFTLIKADTPQQVTSLYQAFLKQTEYEQAVMIILAVIHKPIGIKKLEAVIEALDLIDFLPAQKKQYCLTPQQRKKLINLQLMKSNSAGLSLNKLLNNRLVQSIDQLNTLTPISAQQKLVCIINAAENVVPVINTYDWQIKLENKTRLIRDFYYLGEIDNVIAQFEFNKNPQIVDHDQNKALVELYFLPFELTEFLTLPDILQYQAFASFIRLQQQIGQNLDYAIQLLEQTCDAKLNEAKNIYSLDLLLAEQYLYQLRFDDFNQVISRLSDIQQNSAFGLQCQAVFQLLTGEVAEAIRLFELALTAKNKLSRRKKQYLHELLGYFYKLALTIQANQDDVNYFSQAFNQIEFEQADRKVNSDFYSLGAVWLTPLHCLHIGESYQRHIDFAVVNEDVDYFTHQLGMFSHILGSVWCNQTYDDLLIKRAQQLVTHFNQLGYTLFAYLSEQLLSRLSQGKVAVITSNNASAATKTLPASNLIDLAQQIKAKAQWDIALDKLIALDPKNDTPTPAEPVKATKPIRLIWELFDNNGFNLLAREQKLNKAGWSKGRIVSLKRLHEEADTFDYLTDQDKKMCLAIVAYQGWGYYSKTEYLLGGVNALKAAVGLDNIYKGGDLSQPIEIIEGEPELLVSQQGEQLCLSITELSGSFNDNETDILFNFKALAAFKYQLTVFSPEHIKVVDIIGDNGLLIPVSAKQKALDGISAIAPLLNIQSDISGLDTGLETQPCDPNLVVNIQPSSHGLQFDCVVMPFGEQGPAFKPAIGSASLTTDINGKKVATQRDLAREQGLLDQLDQACPEFLAMTDTTLLLDDLQMALEALSQLESAVAENSFDLSLRWPKGKKVSLSKSLTSEHLQLAVGKKNEWFDITGDLQIDNEQVIELRKILELVKTSNGRFIELGSDQIIALSNDLRQKLEQLNQLTDDGQFHPLASLQIEEATTGMRMKTIHAWDEQTQKMHQANDISPQIPSTFQAELRDYQQVGFDWASRLAHWGAGACLADDMGLGKTLQALAVILSRASQGPTLVIAPTSVCFNWQQEALKFAPTLNIKLFADAPNTEQRSILLNELAPFDCVVISYGLLQREHKILEQTHWHTVVADEAQALKNPLAKRTKAAYALKSDFKMITTGTPIENDLTELWSLFRFINPGLLGNIKRFGERFSLPIDNAQEDKLAARKASQALKALIQPFILRRMKNQVLTELPPRTEINIQVEMSSKEKAFYEALRLNAIDNISQSNDTANAGEQRIRMLAELTKLRQACCNPKLVMAETDLPSAKLEALNELLAELKLNNHKALIFSQFVGHLQLIKQHIEAQGFSYQYLDGSTPQKERQKRVNAFQNGEGDLFLISLKAGGSGLNLTAADYVIHMDPWWNPAVEEQASDRAHRMGQKRPVTIYRLITQNTIEEKIVALHQQKRDLADKLLSGNEVATKLSVDDMLNMLKETF